MKIKKVIAKEILDSRGNPTIEVSVYVNKKVFKASVPSGASTGVYEAVELRDKNGGVQTAVENVNSVINPIVSGMDCCNQNEIDNKMIKLDGTKNKSKLGANAILGVSMAVCRAGAFSRGLELYEYISELSEFKMKMPVPAFNVINGGRHAKNKLSFQEFMILPVGAKNFKEAMNIGKKVYNELRKLIMKKYKIKTIEIGDEGGFAPEISNNEDALKLLKVAIKCSGTEGKIKIGLDIAASEFFEKKKYNLNFKENKKDLKRGIEMIKIYKKFISKYNIISIEDCFEQNDWENWVKFNSKIGKKIQIVGDDLLVTNVFRIKKAISKKACNTLLLKINQIGTISEAIEAAKLVKKNNWKIIVSHRSGETKDDFIADLAVGLGAEQIKSGAPYTSERMVKYERLLKIEKKLKSKN